MLLRFQRCFIQPRQRFPKKLCLQQHRAGAARATPARCHGANHKPRQLDEGCSLYIYNYFFKNFFSLHLPAAGLQQTQQFPARASRGTRTSQQHRVLVGPTSPIETAAPANKQLVLMQPLGRVVGKHLLRALPGSPRALGMVFFVFSFAVGVRGCSGCWALQVLAGSAP